MTTEQVARALGKDRRCVRRLIERGTLVPLAKLPGKTGAYLFDPADIEALVDGPSHTTEDTSAILTRGGAA